MLSTKLEKSIVNFLFRSFIVFLIISALFAFVALAQTPESTSPLETPVITSTVVIPPVDVPTPEDVETSIPAALVALWVLASTMVMERWGKFQDLDTSQKQLAIAVLTYVVPFVVNIVSPFWLDQLGDLSNVVWALAYLLVPVVFWAFGQVVHGFDKQLLPQPK